MRKGELWAWVLAINLLLVVGDVIMKRAVATESRNWPNTWIATGIWIIACFMWIPAIRAPGFTRLIAFADAIGLIIVFAAGHIFLHERLAVREYAGLACTLLAIWLLK